jgi:hypothetical protein
MQRHIGAYRSFELARRAPELRYLFKGKARLLISTLDCRRGKIHACGG